MQPTTSVRRGESKSPVSTATIGRPETECPIVTVRHPTGSGGVAELPAVTGTSSATNAAAIAPPRRSSMAGGSPLRPEPRLNAPTPSPSRQPDEEPAAGSAHVGHDVTVDAAGEPPRERQSEARSVVSARTLRAAADAG